MRLKKLEISGFKSFRERTKFDFPEGISAVVGPNGSGKSNVVDAIRWAMGEQRVKSLRGKKMEDVIFSGSETAAQTGMAEVSLTLVNHNGAFPAPYTDLEEISISRKLFRDSESEYYINNAPCRLLDVREFFMGTGMGGRTYAIIEQNSISGIIEAKPEDIRYFIEEAAGISKYRSRKEAASRKLEAAQANIARVRDILRELKTQLNSLSRQAKRAQAFKTEREDLKKVQLTLSVQRLLELEDKKQELAVKSEASGNTLATLTSSQESIEAEIGAIKVALLEEGETLATAQQLIYEIKNEINIKEQKITFNKEKARALLEQRDAFFAEITSLKDKIAAAEDALVHNAEDARNLAARLAQTQAALETSSARVALLQSYEAELYGAIEKIKSEYVEVVAEKTNHRNLTAELVKAIADWGRKDKQVAGDLAEVCQRWQRALNDREKSLARIAELSAQEEAAQIKLNGIADEKERLRDEIARIGENLDQLRAQLSQKVSRYDSLKEFQRAYSWCPSGAQALLATDTANMPSGLKESIVGAIIDFLEVDAGFENAVEALLGERISSVIVSSWEQGIGAIEYIRQFLLERSSVIALGIKSPTLDMDIVGLKRVVDFVKPAPSYESLIRHLLRNSYIVENVAEGARLWQQNGGGNFVTLEGDLIGEQGVIVGGARGQDEAGLFKTRREMADLEHEKESIAATITADDAIKKRCIALLHQFEEEEMNTQRSLNASTLGASVARKEAEHLANEIAQLRQRMDVLEFEAKNIAEEIVAAQDNLSLSQTGETQSSQKETELNERIAQAQNRWTLAKEDLAGAQETLTSQKIALAEMQADSRAKEDASMVLKSTLTDIQGTMDERASGMSKNQEEANRIIAENETERGDIEMLLERNTQSEATLNDIRQRCALKEKSLSTLESDLRDLLKQKEGVQKEEAEAQTEYRNISYQHDSARQALIEKGYENIAEILAAAQILPAEEIATLNEAAEKKRRFVENFGEVNLLALGEYEQLKERHDFMAAQEEDINNAITTLQRTITRINNISRRRFAATFDGINAHFQQVFPRLFPGGRGQLSLTNKEDLLETGVDVEIHVPNKKMQNLSLLSGGEKSLSAIALIFALVFYKPSSFLILDEVDAALDDANIALFNNILKDVAALSQVLVVTHNRSSMEFADSLYGISMRQDGTSMSISVNLQTQQQQA